jgi:hypothetical protein
MKIRIGRSRRQGNRRGNLLNRLDLMLDRRGVGRTAGERRTIGRSRVNGVQLQQIDVNITGPVGYRTGKIGGEVLGVAATYIILCQETRAEL